MAKIDLQDGRGYDCDTCGRFGDSLKGDGNGNGNGFDTDRPPKDTDFYLEFYIQSEPPWFEEER